MYLPRLFVSFIIFPYLSWFSSLIPIHPISSLFQSTWIKFWFPTSHVHPGPVLLKGQGWSTNKMQDVGHRNASNGLHEISNEPSPNGNSWGLPRGSSWCFTARGIFSLTTQFECTKWTSCQLYTGEPPDAIQFTTSTPVEIPQARLEMKDSEWPKVAQTIEPRYGKLCRATVWERQQNGSDCCDNGCRDWETSSTKALGTEGQDPREVENVPNTCDLLPGSRTSRRLTTSHHYIRYCKPSIFWPNWFQTSSQT